MSLYEEGCLSIPDYYAEVERPDTVTVKYLDLSGKETITADGLLATCLQHEIDHLNGVLFIDHISKLKRHGRAPLPQAGEGQGPQGFRRIRRRPPPRIPMSRALIRAA